jgi:YD repeat-containing protein
MRDWRPAVCWRETPISFDDAEQASPLAVVARAAFGGCGGSAAHHSTSRQVKIVRPGRPVWCPTGKISPARSEPNTPAPHSFDARAILAMTETDAPAAVRRRGCKWRVVARDGRDLTITRDANGQRVDATVANGIVTAIGVN